MAGRLTCAIAFFLAAISIADAQGIVGVAVAVGEFCSNLTEILPIIAMLLIIGGGVVYAAGQIMGAETRARAAGWATAMLIGAVIGILIATVAPSIISAMYGCQISCGGAFIVGGGLPPC